MKQSLVLLVCMALPMALRADDDDAREVLAEMNLARTQPREYARIVARSARPGRAATEAVHFLQKVAQLPPLRHSSALAGAAREHVSEQGARGAVGHSGRRGESPFRRIARHGTWLGSVGENIDYGGGSARATVIRLIVDEGTLFRKHRANIFSRAFRVTGIATGAHARYGSMCVMDFADGFIAHRGRAGSR